MPDELRNALVEISIGILGVMTPVLLLYLRKLARKLTEAVDVELSEQQWRNVDATLEMSVRHAEEFARNQLRRGGAVQSAEKLQVALETARRVGAGDLSSYDDETLQRMLEAKLQAVRPSMAPAVALWPQQTTLEED